MKLALTAQGLRAIAAAAFLIAGSLPGLQAHANDGNRPVVSVLAGSGITEGGVASFWLLPSRLSATPLTVSVSIGQTGSFLASGQTGRRTVTIPANRGQVRFTVRTTDDGRNEPAGSVDVTVNPGSGYRAAEDAYRSASVAVADNDRPVITIGAGPKISEGGTARFTLSASPRPAAPIDVAVTVTEKGEFASQGQKGQRTVRIGTNGRGSLSVATDSDARDEDDGYITARLVGGQAYAVGAPASANVDVSDGGAPTPRISVRALSSAIVEGGTASFELTASPRPAAPLNVRVEITDSGSFASQGEAGTRIVTIGANGRATIDVETENDLVSEPDGSLTARVLSDAGYLVTSSGRASVAVRDESIEVRISAAGDIVEGDTARFTLTAHPAPPESLVVTVSIAENGSFLSQGAHEQSITVGTDGRGTFSVDTTNDEKAEADGAIVATVQSGYGYAPGSPGRAKARVSDATPTITIAAGPSVVEGDTATFALTARPAPEHNLTVRLDVTEIAGGTFAPSDELGQRDATIFTDGTGTLEVRTDDDEQDEGSGTITARILSDADGYYRIGSPRSATLQVNDDDHNRNALTVSVGDASVTEGQRFEYGRRIIKFPVTLSKPTNRWVSVSLQTRPHEDAANPATPDVDYRATRYGRHWGAWFPAGVTERFVNIEIYDDDEYEPDPETFELVISRVYGAEIADGRAIGTILPDPSDAPRGTPVVTITGGGAVEEGQNVTFTLTAEPAPAEDLVVQVRVYDESLGTPASDYLAEDDEGLHDVTIPGVNKRLFQYYKDSPARFTLRTVDDAEEEAGGRIFAQIEPAVDGSYDTSQEPYSAEVGVRDNDGPPPSVRPAIRIADATANESDGSILFDVTLDPAVPYGAGPMTVDYRTYSGVARANVDFEGKSGTLTFYEGESFKQIEINILEDQHDEGEESFYAYLRNARGGARIADGWARGTIVNSDPMPAAWLARFGRTVAGQMVEALEGRFAMGADTPSHMTVAGQRLDFSGAPVPRHDRWENGDERGMDMRELLLGSSFHLTTGEVSGLGAVTGWGKALSGSSSASPGDGLTLTSETVTGVLGMDWERDNLLVGLALSETVEEGSALSGSSEYDLKGSLSLVTPYARIRASERLSFWAMTGTGEGSLSLAYGDARHSTDIAMQLVAAGGRADLLRPDESGGLALALKTDALFVRTESESVSTPGAGNLAGATGDASRVRALLEGSRAFALAGGSSVEPSLSLGLRHDGGDAETGTGVEVGAGLAWSDPSNGLTSDLRVHGLAAHEDAGYDEWGVSGSLRIAPEPSGRGISLSMTPSWGARGQDGLWDAQPSELADDGDEPTSVRFDTELGYGLSLPGGLTGTPYAGFRFGEDRDYRLGWRLMSGRLRFFSLGVEAVRRETDDGSGSSAGKAEHRIGLEASLRW